MDFNKIELKKYGEMGTHFLKIKKFKCLFSSNNIF